MRSRRIHGWLVLSTSVLVAIPATVRGQQAPAAPRVYNTVKQKLAEGKQVVGGTVLLPDPDRYN
jgi:hypothetical protein